jgi:chromosome segregation ATPase
MSEIDEKLASIEDKLAVLEDLLFVSQLDIINLKNEIKTAPSLPNEIKERLSLLGKKAEKIETEPEFSKELRKAIDDLNKNLNMLKERFESETKRIDSKVDDFLKKVRDVSAKKKINVTIGSPSDAKIAELEQKINNLIENVNKIKDLKPIELPTDVELADIRDEIEKLKSKIDAMSKTGKDVTPNYEERIRLLEQKMSAISIGEKADLNNRMTRIEVELQSIRKMLKIMKAEQEYIKGNFEKIVKEKIEEIEKKFKSMSTNVPFVIE